MMCDRRLEGVIDRSRVFKGSMRNLLFHSLSSAQRAVCELGNDRDNGSDRRRLFFLLLAQVPAQRGEQGKLRQVVRGRFELDMRPSFQVEQRRALVVEPDPVIVPEAAALPAVLAPIGKEQGGLTAHPTRD